VAETKSKKELLKDMLFATFGTFLLGIAIHFFFDAKDIVTGGVTGLGIIFERLSQRHLSFTIPIWLTNLMFNVPLLIAGKKFKGTVFVLKTLYCTVFLSLVLFLLGFTKVNEVSDILLASIYGGVIAGTGLGFVFKGSASTGGTDLLATLIHQKYPHLSVSKLVVYLDAVTVALGLFVFGVQMVMYAIIAIYISGKIIESVLEGINFSKAVFIISDTPDDISAEIMEKIQRGVTGLYGCGMYTKISKTVILTVVDVKEIVLLKEIVKEIDGNAFIIVADVKEVLGEGFQKFV